MLASYCKKTTLGGDKKLIVCFEFAEGGDLEGLIAKHRKLGLPFE
jgi:hypothetical protein